MIRINHSYIKNSNIDALFIIVGEGGLGKSSLELWLASLHEKQNNRELDLMRCVALDSGRFMFNCNETNRYAASCLDEGIEGMFSREAMSKENKELLKMLTQLRSRRNLLIIINITDLSLMEKHIRKFRARAILRVWAKNDKKNHTLKKGFVDVYGKREIKKIKFVDGSVVFPKRPRFRDTFPDMAVVNPKLWQEYEALADKLKQDNRGKGIAKVTGRDDALKAEMDNFIYETRRKKGLTVKGIHNELYKRYGKEAYGIITVHKRLKIAGY